MNILSSTLSEGGVGYTTANENFFRLDAFVQFSVKDRTLTAPPGSPTEGDRYLVKATGTSAWAGHDAQIAIYHNATWIFFTPQEGWQMWVDNENALLTYNGTSWVNQTTALLDATGRVAVSQLVRLNSAFILVADTAYFVYLGKVMVDTTINFVRSVVRNAGAGAQTAEFGLFSTISAPNRTALSFTKIAATGSVGSLTAAGPVANSSTFAQAVVAGTHLWAGVRSNMATTQPTFNSLVLDGGQGRIQSTATAGALTGAGPWTGVIPTDTAGAALGPQLEISLD